MMYFRFQYTAAHRALFAVFRFFLLGFGIIGVYHIFFDLRICRVSTHESARGKDENENADDGDRDKERAEPYDEEDHEANARKHGKIAPEAEKREDHGIFDDLEEAKLKRHHDGIEIETNERIEHDDEKHRPEENVIVIVVDVIAHEREKGKRDDTKVENTHRERLLPVSFDGRDEILPKENGLTLDEVFDDIRTARVDRSERKDKERGNGVEDIGHDRR